MARYEFKTSEDYARKLDDEDPLAKFRDRFYLIPDSIYMDGNSLGLLSRDAEESLLRILNEWKKLGIGGWSSGKIPWIKYAERLGELESELVGARPEEVVVCGSTTVNLHTLVATFYEPEGRRRKIIADELNFPSDLYALDAQIRLKGNNPSQDLVLVKSRDGNLIEEEDVIDAMSDEVSIVLLPSVYYKSGQLTDMERLTREAHKREIIIGFDCSHSVGVVQHKLSDLEVDFAFWCNYKYMNGGPGSTASLYVNRKHFGKRPGLAGWFGNERSTMFNMDVKFDPARDASAWQIGTTFMLSTAPIEGSLKMMHEAGINRIREKSLKITSYLMFLIDETLSKPPYNYSIGTPRAPERRGGHVGVVHEEAYRINEALKARKVIPDFRPPNVIRLAPIPLYVSYQEVWQVVQNLKAIIDNDEYERFPKSRGLVT